MRRITRYSMVLLLALLSAMAWAAPMGLSVNSDGGDILHQIDLGTGSSISLGVEFTDNKDIEGLAFAPAPDSTLWAVDEDKFSMFQISPVTGLKLLGTEVTIVGTLTNIFNDFGLTFTCDGTLYASSVTSQTLYTINQAGIATVVGGLGQLGFNISALASYGDNPTVLYGLGNGLISEDESSPDNRSLFQIDLVTGIAAPIGSGIGGQVAPYHEAGLSFDDSGVLWGISDRSLLGGLSSEIFTIDPVSGVATLMADTGDVTGFESLAIATPTQCNVPVPRSAAVPVPSLGDKAKLLTILILMISGMVGLRYRAS